jgi:Subunit CCDC53 of WASH complex
VGLPKPAVAQKMFSEGVVTSIDAGLELLAQDPEVAAPAPGGSSGPSAGAGSGSGKSDDKVAIKDHPQYSKYFKMLKVGLPIDAVKAKMQQEGINSDYIDKVKTQIFYTSF